MARFWFTILLGLCLISYPAMGWAEQDRKNAVPDRYGFAMIAGTTYDPNNDIRLYMLSVFALFDYEKVWRQKAPESLRFKVELNLGIGDDAEPRFMTSMNIMALRFIDAFSSDCFSPFVEAGIGLIYTDFRVKGQGLRFNFNPQLGMGTEFKTRSDDVYFVTFRLHHISNGGLHEDNRGVNSTILLFGRFF